MDQNTQKRPERGQPAAPAVGHSGSGPRPSPPAAPLLERHPKLAMLILVALWLYVAALWLLALDQIFNWGIFGPKVPPI